MREEGLTTRCLAELEKLPFVQGARLNDVRAGDPAVDGVVVVQALTGEYRLLVEVKRTNVGHALVDAIIARTARTEQPWILFAPLVTPGVGRRLADADVNFIDPQGNCRVALGDQHLAWVEGRQPPTRKPGERGIGAAGYQVLFALLANDDFLDATVRELGEAAGVSAGTAANTLRRLVDNGHVVETGDGRQFVDRRPVLDRWLTGYIDTVRPRWLMGRFRAREADPLAREEQLEPLLEQEDLPWAWGGGAAADRLQHYYHGPETVLHVEEPGEDLARKLGLLRDEDGPVVILRTPGTVPYEGELPRTAHPLLVYTELATHKEERAREAATRLREAYLTWL